MFPGSGDTCSALPSLAISLIVQTPHQALQRLHSLLLTPVPRGLTPGASQSHVSSNEMAFLNNQPCYLSDHVQSPGPGAQLSLGFPAPCCPQPPQTINLSPKKNGLFASDLKVRSQQGCLWWTPLRSGRRFKQDGSRPSSLLMVSPAFTKAAGLTAPVWPGPPGPGGTVTKDRQLSCARTHMPSPHLPG